MLGEMLNIFQPILAWFTNIRIIITATGVPLLSKGPIMMISLIFLYLNRKK